MNNFNKLRKGNSWTRPTKNHVNTLTMMHPNPRNVNQILKSLVALTLTTSNKKSLANKTVRNKLTNYYYKKYFERKTIPAFIVNSRGTRVKHTLRYPRLLKKN